MNSTTRLLAPAALLAATFAMTGGCPQQDTATLGIVPGGIPGLKEIPSTGTPAPQTPAEVDPLPSPPPPLPLPRPSVVGNWLLEDGKLLPGFDAALRVTAMTFGDDGYSRVFFSDISTGAKDCVRAFGLFDGDTMVLDLSDEPSVAANPERAMFFPVVVVENSRLLMADATGQVAIFTREIDLPPDVVCGELEVIDIFQGLPAPHSFGDLTLHFGDLIYNSNNNNIELFDLDTGALGTPIAPTSNRFVQTKQGVDFWTHCGCGGSPDIFRRSLTTVFDTIHTGNDLGQQIVIRAAEYLPTTDRLWLHGISTADSRFRFLIVNTNGEPDTLTQTIFYNRDVRGLSFDGTDLWALVTMASRSIVRMDATTAQAIESYELPDEDISWTGLEFAGDSLYAIGTDSTGQGVLYRLARP